MKSSSLSTPNKFGLYNSNTGNPKEGRNATSNPDSEVFRNKFLPLRNYTESLSASRSHKLRPNLYRHSAARIFLKYWFEILHWSESVYSGHCRDKFPIEEMLDVASISHIIPSCGWD